VNREHQTVLECYTSRRLTKRLHANAAIASLFHVGHHWRGVGERGSLGLDAMKQWIPHLLWSVGVVLLLIAAGRGSGAALAYQDPRPELLAVQRGQLHAAAAYHFG
jgi:hypothetical protein